MRGYVSWYKYAVKAKRNKGMKNAGHGLNPGCRYWCHASDSLTEPSGPAASQQAYIPISLHHEPKFSQDCHQAIPSHSHCSHLNSHWVGHSNISDFKIVYTSSSLLQLLISNSLDSIHFYCSVSPGLHRFFFILYSTIYPPRHYSTSVADSAHQ